MLVLRLGGGGSLSFLRSLTPCLSSPQLRYSSTDPDKAAPTKAGPLEALFGLASNTASPATNIWAMFVPAFRGGC